MKNNKIGDKLKNIAESKAKNEGLKSRSQSEMLSQMTERKDDTTDIEAIAEEFMKRHEEKASGANDGYTKDTIYIEDALYNAMQALCLSRGDKKVHVNNAYRDYIIKMHKQLRSE